MYNRGEVEMRDESYFAYNLRTQADNPDNPYFTNVRNMQVIEPACVKCPFCGVTSTESERVTCTQCGGPLLLGEDKQNTDTKSNVEDVDVLVQEDFGHTPLDIFCITSTIGIWILVVFCLMGVLLW